MNPDTPIHTQLYQKTCLLPISSWQTLYFIDSEQCNYNITAVECLNTYMHIQTHTTVILWLIISLQMSDQKWHWKKKKQKNTHFSTKEKACIAWFPYSVKHLKLHQLLDGLMAKYTDNVRILSPLTLQFSCPLMFCSVQGALCWEL